MISVRQPPTIPETASPLASGEPISETRFSLGSLTSRALTPGFAAWLITAGLIVYLGMKNGGYEQPVYSEIGIAAWWLIGIGCLAGALSMRIGRAGWIGLGLFAAFTAWTALGVVWSESSGRSMIEVARVLTYLGLFAVALLLAGRGRTRLILGAIATGVAVVGIVALLSRLHPSWFPDSDIPSSIIGVEKRLSYPVGYFNALAALIAIGFPLLLWAAAKARSIPLRALAAAAIPPLLLTTYYTYSRAGIIAILVALILFVTLAERRLTLLPTIAVVGLGGGGLIWQASQRVQIADALPTETAASQGDRMLLFAIAVALLAGLIVAGLAIADRRGRLPRVPTVPKRQAMIATGVAAALAIGTFVGLGGIGETSDAYEDFKSTTGLNDSSSRLDSLGGNGRWQYWEQALNANAEAPLNGIGPGTYVFYWSENRPFDNGLVRDAHSLYVETLGELGIVGLMLIVGFVLFVLVVGGGRAIESIGERRLEMAAATAAAVAFVVSTALDWVWELAVVPVAFLFVAAAILRSEPEEPDWAALASLPEEEAPAEESRPFWRSPLAAGLATMLLAAASIFVIYVTYESDKRLTQSQEEFSAGDLDAALESAEGAIELQPFAGEPLIQKAFVLERQGELNKAAGAAREAIEAESRNWENWFALARIQQQRGKEGSAIRALRRAQELNPVSQVLNPVNCGKNDELCRTIIPE